MPPICVFQWPKKPWQCDRIMKLNLLKGIQSLNFIFALTETVWDVKMSPVKKGCRILKCFKLLCFIISFYCFVILFYNVNISLSVIVAPNSTSYLTRTLLLTHSLWGDWPCRLVMFLYFTRLKTASYSKKERKKSRIFRVSCTYAFHSPCLPQLSLWLMLNVSVFHFNSERATLRACAFKIVPLLAVVICKHGTNVEAKEAVC